MGFIHGTPQFLQRYAAVSHVWGNTTPSPPAFHRPSFPLSSAAKLKTLQTLASSADNLPIWMDVISIDQQCDRDKEYQMGHMFNIYDRAERVYLLMPDEEYVKLAAWIGEVTRRWEGVDSAAGVVELETKRGEHPPMGVHGTRLWTLQEMILAKSCTLVSEDGEKSADERPYVVIDNVFESVLHSLRRIADREPLNFGAVILATEPLRVLAAAIYSRTIVAWARRNCTGVTSAHVGQFDVQTILDRTCFLEKDTFHATYRLFYPNAETVDYSLSLDQALTLFADRLKDKGLLPPGDSAPSSYWPWLVGRCGGRRMRAGGWLSSFAILTCATTWADGGVNAGGNCGVVGGGNVVEGGGDRETKRGSCQISATESVIMPATPHHSPTIASIAETMTYQAVRLALSRGAKLSFAQVPLTVTLWDRDGPGRVSASLAYLQRNRSAAMRRESIADPQQHTTPHLPLDPGSARFLGSIIARAAAYIQHTSRTSTPFSLLAVQASLENSTHTYTQICVTSTPLLSNPNLTLSYQGGGFVLLDTRSVVVARLQPLLWFSSTLGITSVSKIGFMTNAGMKLGFDARVGSLVQQPVDGGKLVVEEREE
ncbi:hypothetical protein HK104_002111 [Borealophlyctis nickersoniae]|nr:hypothetical protein HK104_002111 [Borealophlyctis nickersoniae]